MVKKAQGALEFLMTYGWAFLVILIMIGALAYFGVLDPSRFLPDRCDFGTQVLCKKDQFVVQSADDVTVMATVTNNVGSNIMLYGLNATTDVSGVVCTAGCWEGDTPADGCGDAADTDLWNIASAAAVVWRAGESRILVLDCTNGANMVAGDKNKFQYNFKWYSSSAGAAYSRDGSGEIYASVQ